MGSWPGSSSQGWGRWSRSHRWWWASTRPKLSDTSGPDGAVGIRVLLERGGVHLCAETRQGGRQIVAVDDAHRVDEVLVQVVDVLDDTVLGGAGDGDVVEHRQVLDHLAQTHPSGVRADRHAELRGEQQDRDVLVDAADPRRVDLHDV